MAHTKSQGSTSNGRDSHSKRLGVKCFEGQIVTAGSIIVRQRGRKLRAGLNVGIGKDNTLFAKKQGKLQFKWISKFNRQVNILPVSPEPVSGVN